MGRMDSLPSGSFLAVFCKAALSPFALEANKIPHRVEELRNAEGNEGHAAGLLAEMWLRWELLGILSEPRSADTRAQQSAHVRGALWGWVEEDAIEAAQMLRLKEPRSTLFSFLNYIFLFSFCLSVVVCLFHWSVVDLQWCVSSRYATSDSYISVSRWFFSLISYYKILGMVLWHPIQCF